MPTPVRYTGNKDADLRYALWSAWNNTCYWCWQPTDFNEIEIDHIVSKKSSANELARARTNFGLDSSFDIDEPYNLAPICGPCNSEKSNRDLSAFPLVAVKLNKARYYHPKVVKEVNSMRAAPATARNFVKLAEVNLKDQRALDLVKSSGPAVARMLSRAGVRADLIEKVVVVTDHRYGLSEVIDVMLSDRGVATKHILVDAFRNDWDDILSQIVRNVLRELERELLSRVRHLDSLGFGDVVADSVALVRPALELATCDFAWFHDYVEFTFAGSVRTDFEGHVVQDRQDGDGLLEDLQAEGSVIATFTIEVSHGLPDDEPLDPFDPVLEIGEQDFYGWIE